MRLDQLTVFGDMDLVQGVLVALMTIPLAWQVVSGFGFKHLVHINMLGAVALFTCVLGFAKAGLHSRRIMLLIDSGAVRGFATSGRSSSIQLNHVLRKLAGLLLAHDLYVSIILDTYAHT